MLFSRQIPEIESYEVVIAGAGSAGATAAIASARAGAKTLLIERYGFLGGISTGVLDTFYGFYTPGKKARKVVGGIADEVVAGLNQFGVCFERPNTYGAGTGVTYHPEYLKVVWERLALTAGCTLLMHTLVQDVVRSQGQIEGLVLATRGGLRLVRAKVFIDATGDADLCAYAGLEFNPAEPTAPAQMLTTTFRVCNVDLSARQKISKQEFQDLMQQAAESGNYDLPRREGSDHAMPITGFTSTNMTRVASCRGTANGVAHAAESAFLSDAEVEGRRQALEYLRFLRDLVPGYGKAELASFSTQIGVRETRRVCGDYVLTREDVLGARRFDDNIGLCGAPIEDHHSGAGTRWEYLPDGECVGIPFRTLLPKDADNLLVAGRCFSATHDAHASVRSMAQCMAMGQAAGCAGALATKRGVSPRELPIATLRSELEVSGAILSLAEGVA
jgi:glycine/D-amino acid oxidase-like deaminating enzyme